jgi:MOSC domain-containing protein YiiM
VSFDGEQVDLTWIGRHAVHDAMHHLHDVGRIRVRLGDGVPTQQGSVVNLARSDGGVPKLPAAAVDVDVDGVIGDRQGDRKHHGRPFQALCLWSMDVIEALQGEGHPITAGAAGENVTVAGIDWASLRPGTRLRVGEVLCELSAAATPCAKNAQWFADGQFARIDHDLHPGWSRLYATVLEAGPIAVGDAVEVEPDL